MKIEVGYSNITTGNHAHKPGCRDLKRWVDQSNTRAVEAIEAESAKALIENLFGDLLDPDDPNEWRNYLDRTYDDLRIYPCLSDLKEQ